MDLFGILRLVAGSRQLLLLLVFALLLHLGLIAFTPVSVEVWDETFLIDQTIIMVVTLLCAAWLVVKAAWHRIKDAGLEASIKVLLGHNKPYLFSFDTAGVFANSENVMLPPRWGAMIRPKAGVDNDYDAICKAVMSQLDSYCFGPKTTQFRFSGDNAANSRINLAITLRSAPGKDDGKGLAGFGFIETTRQSGEKARFIVATDESISHPDLTTSILSAFSVKADIPISLRQYVSPIGLDRYFHIHLLIPFRRKHMLAKWRVNPILMFVDFISQSSSGVIFERHRKILLGYGGQEP